MLLGKKNVLNFKRTIDEAKMWLKQYSSIKGLYFNLKVLEGTYNLDKNYFEIMFLNMLWISINHKSLYWHGVSNTV